LTRRIDSDFFVVRVDSRGRGYNKKNQIDWKVMLLMPLFKTLVLLLAVVCQRSSGEHNEFYWIAFDVDSIPFERGDATVADYDFEYDFPVDVGECFGGSPFTF